MKKAIIFVLVLIIAGILFAGEVKANEPPVWHKIPSKAGFVDKLISFSVFAYDADGDELTYSAINLPSGSNFNPRTKIFSWIPVSSGNYTVTFKAYDGFEWIDTSVRIVVRDLNQSSVSDGDGSESVGPPTFVNFNPPLVATEGQLYTYTVQAAGSIGARVGYRLAASPQGMIINSKTGVVLWTPNFNQGRNEPYNVTVGISNAQFENQRSFKLFVQDINQAAFQSPPDSGSRKPVPVFKAPKPESKKPLSISNVEVKKAGGDIVITWKTNLPSIGRVIYDTESQADKKRDFTYKNATIDSEALKEHEARISGSNLKEGETYYFRAVAKKNAEIVVSGEMVFETGKQGLALLSSLGDFFSNPWLWIIIVLILLWIVFRKVIKK